MLYKMSKNTIDVYQQKALLHIAALTILDINIYQENRTRRMPKQINMLLLITGDFLGYL